MSTGKIKKKERTIKIIQENNGFFKCPICSNPMRVGALNSLVCKKDHLYDLSKKGSINFMGNFSNPVYSKELFEARNKVCKAGFYDPLLEELVKIITQHQTSKKGNITVLDVGCGEGSNISGILNRMEETIHPLFIGLDISKESVNIAARNDADIIWCVGDLANLPFLNKSIDVALNIFSPANYGEFRRVLSDDGIVVKVVPGSNYLKELREIFYAGKEKSEYHNDRVLKYFEEKMEVLDVRDIYYQFNVESEMLNAFSQMTPLTWEKDIRLITSLGQQIDKLTADFTIIVGKKKSSLD